MPSNKQRRNAKKPGWAQTERSLETNENNQIIKKHFKYTTKSGWVTRNKDWIGILLQFLGFAGIITPIFLFYQQQRSESERQKKTLKYEIFSSLDAELHSFVDKRDNDIEISQAKEKILFEITPKTILFNDKKISDSLESLKQNVQFFSLYFPYANALDSLTSWSLIFYNNSIQQPPIRFNNPTFIFNHYANSLTRFGFDLAQLLYSPAYQSDEYEKIRQNLEKVESIYSFWNGAVFDQIDNTKDAVERRRFLQAEYKFVQDLSTINRNNHETSNSIIIKYQTSLNNLDTLFISSLKLF